MRRFPALRHDEAAPESAAAAAAESVAVVCFGFEADRVRRQPWHVAHGVASGCAALGHRVRLFTDAADPPAPDAYAITGLTSLFDGGGASAALRAAVAAFRPSRVLLVCGTLRLARLGPLGFDAPTFLVMTSPRLKARELARLSPAAWWREWHVLRGPLLDALVPGALLRRGFARSGAASTLYLSQAAQVRYRLLGLPRGRLLPPQVDPAPLPSPPRAPAADPAAAGRPRIVYLGPALELRGALAAVEAFEAATASGLDAELLLLLRPDGGPEAMLRLLRRVRNSPCRARVRCVSRMLSPAELRERLAACHVFLLPFKVPVSEVPLVVIEAGLSGRPLVVLDAPGVTEYARRFGGLVARDAAELPDLLRRACLTRPLRRPDPAPWTRWDEALRPLMADAHADLARHRLVALIGVDGSGKTFLLDHLREGLRRAGIPHRHVWSRFRNYLSKPLLALTRLTGHNVKARIGEVRIGYHEFERSRALSLAFLALQAVDQVLDILLRYRRGGPWGGRPGPILGDRCVYDTLVDLAVDTGLDDLVIDRIGPRLVALLPRPRLVVLVSRPVRLVRESRPDALLDRNFARRRALYERVAARFGIPVIENDGPPEAAVAQVLRLAGEAAREATAGARSP